MRSQTMWDSDMCIGLDAFPPSSGELLIPVVAVVEGGSGPTSSIAIRKPNHTHSALEDINFTLVNGLPDTNRGFDDDYLVVSGEWFLPGRRCPTKDGVPDSRRRTPRKNLIKINSLRQVWESELCTDEHAQPRSAPKLLRYTAQDSFLPSLDVLDTEAPDMSGMKSEKSAPYPARGGYYGERAGLLSTGSEEESEDGKLSRAKPKGKDRYHYGPPEWSTGGRMSVTEADCILPVNETRSGSVASALSQVVRLPLDMDEWKKATDDGLINNPEEGPTHGGPSFLGAGGTVSGPTRTTSLMPMSWHSSIRTPRRWQLMLRKWLKPRMLKGSEFDQAKKAAYEAGSSDAQAEMGDQLPGVCNEFYSDGWKKAVSILSSGQTTLPPLQPSVPYPGAWPPPPPEVVLATPLEVPVTPIPEISADVVNLEDEVNSAEAAAPDDAAQAPGVPDGGGAVPDEAGPSV
uniref:Uncharacterized protein n=1 Tax=Fagus sylvatica TaxID=28930 RepID=A0A2N9FY98_FAGSY